MGSGLYSVLRGLDSRKEGSTPFLSANSSSGGGRGGGGGGSDRQMLSLMRPTPTTAELTLEGYIHTVHNTSCLTHSLPTYPPHSDIYY